ncbi:MAG: hypothetical protein ACOH5I_08845 [Oligoflexus sp.]
MKNLLIILLAVALIGIALNYFRPSSGGARVEQTPAGASSSHQDRETASISGAADEAAAEDETEIHQQVTMTSINKSQSAVTTDQAKQTMLLLSHLTSDLALAASSPADLQQILSDMNIPAQFLQAGHPSSGERLELDVFPNRNDLIELHAVYDLFHDKPEFSSLRYRLAMEHSDFGGFVEKMASELGHDASLLQRAPDLARWQLSSSDKVVTIRHYPPAAQAAHVLVLLEYAHEHR